MNPIRPFKRSFADIFFVFCTGGALAPGLMLTLYKEAFCIGIHAHSVLKGLWSRDSCPLCMKRPFTSLIHAHPVRKGLLHRFSNQSAKMRDISKAYCAYVTLRVCM